MNSDTLQDQINIHIESGDVTDNKYPIFVIPRDTNGNYNGTFLKNDSWASTNLTDQSTELGEIEFKKKPGARKRKGVIWATSVKFSNDKIDFDSNANAIQEIGKKLATHSRQGVTIACPLLGTGAGKLSNKQSYLSLVRGFRSRSPKGPLTIVVQKDSIKQMLEEAEQDEQERLEGKKTHAVRLDMLHDQSIADEEGDLLDFKTFSRALTGIIDSPSTKTPLTLVVNAPWGAGKSSLGNMMQTRLEDMPANSLRKHRTLFFNAWLHDDADYLKTAFTAFIARELNPYRSLWHQQMDPLPLDMMAPSDRFNRRVRNLLIYVVLGTLIFLSYKWLSSIELLKPFIENISAGLFTSIGSFLGISKELAAGGTGLFSVALFKFLMQFSATLKSYIKNPASEANAGKVKDVRVQLHKLIDQAIPNDRRLIVFVDDLERCRGTGPVDLLEAVNQLLAHPRVVTVIMADIYTVAASADLKYEEFAKRYNPASGQFGDLEAQKNKGAYGRLYIQKIIQLQFDLPVFQPEQMNVLIDNQKKDEGKKEEPSKPEEKKVEKPSVSELRQLTNNQLTWNAISLREVMMNDRVNGYQRFGLFLFQLIAYPPFLLSGLLRYFFPNYWGYEEDSIGRKRLDLGNHILIWLFAILALFTYAISAMNLFQRVSHQNNFNRSYVQRFLDQNPTTADTIQNELAFTSADSGFFAGYYHRQTIGWNYDSLRESDTIHKFVGDSIAPIYFLKLAIDSTITNLETIQSDSLIRTQYFASVRNVKVGLDTLWNKTGNSTAIIKARNDVLNAYESATNRFINAFIYSRTNLPWEKQLWWMYLGILASIGCLQIFGLRYFYRKRSRYLEETENKITAQLNKDEALNTVLATDSEDQDQAEADIHRKLIYERIKEKSVLFQQSMRETLKILGLVLPRNAKRVSNKMRLMFNVALERGILERLSSEHFAKWVALQETYPEFVAHVSKKPSDMIVAETLCRTWENTKANSTPENAVNEQVQQEIGIKSSSEAEKAYKTFMNTIHPTFGEDQKLAEYILYGGEAFDLSHRIQELVYFQSKEKLEVPIVTEELN